MRKSTLIVLLIVVAALITGAIAMHGQGATRLHEWFREIHGGGGH
jgi:hypothetical protein